MHFVFTYFSILLNSRESRGGQLILFTVITITINAILSSDAVNANAADLFQHFVKSHRVGMSA